MAKSKKVRIAPPVDKNDAHALVTNLDGIIANFKGDMHDLESAIGMFMVGRLMGWKVLVLIHNKRTIRKYEDYLGIKIRDAFPPETDLSDKSVAYDLVQRLGSFWKAVSGELKDDQLRDQRKMAL
ncbi:MAG: hypothetical protein AB1642_05555 [Pseudomonadota bacterium]